MTIVEKAKLEMITAAIEANIKIGRAFKESKKDILDFGGNDLSQATRCMLIKNC